MVAEQKYLVASLLYEEGGATDGGVGQRSVSLVALNTCTDRQKQLPRGTE